MKKILFILLTFFSVSAFSQKHITAYIELRAAPNIFGDMILENIRMPSGAVKIDSLIDYNSIKSLSKYSDLILVLNKLSGQGWELVSVTSVSANKDAINASPFILYYLKHEYKIE